MEIFGGGSAHHARTLKRRWQAYEGRQRRVGKTLIGNEETEAKNGSTKMGDGENSERRK